MEEWRAFRPVDVARLNSSVFVALFRKYGLLFALALPAYLGGALLLAAERFPKLGVAHILSVAAPLFLAGFVTHLAVGLLGAVFLVAVGSLVWWRHILATGAPSAVRGVIASSARRIVFRLARQIDAGTFAVLARRSRELLLVPVHGLLDQLSAALCIAADARLEALRRPYHCSHVRPLRPRYATGSAGPAVRRGVGSGHRRRVASELERCPGDRCARAGR
ncbi:MAG: hypothetical protein ACYCXY_10340 [Acidimicrobiales bacterium]